MKKHPGGKFWIGAAAAVGTAAVAGQVYRKIRNSHHQLVSALGEELLGAAVSQQEQCREAAGKTGNGPGEGEGRAEVSAQGIPEKSQSASVKIWDSYPRPQMRRDSFYSLNGSWELNGQKILVPFPPQSLLSGYRGKVGTHLTYSREFTLPGEWKKGRVLLHFGAVDQVAEVFLNGHLLGRHEGGYLPFSFDMTAYVSEGTNRIDVNAVDTLSARYPYGKQRRARGGMWYTPVSGIWQSVWMECVPLVFIAGLKVETDTQKVRISVRRGGGVDCREETGTAGGEGAETKVSTVKEPLAETGVHAVCKAEFGERGKFNEDAARREKGAAGSKVMGAEIPAQGHAAEEKAEKSFDGTGTGTEESAADRQSAKTEDGITVTVTLHDGTRHTVRTAGTEAEINLAEIRLADGKLYQPVPWNTEHPYLYEMSVAMGEDTVFSYFGLRTIEVKKVDGIPKVCLNGDPVFLQGVLDQGYFCDGIYLPAKAEEYEQDVLRMKALGMNLLRKHIKIEPECFYYYCDLHGMLVMQDMVNNGFYSWIRDTALPTLGFCRKKDEKSRYGRKRREFFVRHMEETIKHLHNHPCIIAYTIFNEGWGQFDSDALYRQAKALDSTRLYDATSGWFSQTESDFDSQHIYFKKLEIPQKPEKPVLVSECGGYSLREAGHFYSKYARYGYGGCKSRTELTLRVKKLYEKTILPGVSRGLCGCIYTQLCDVEDEVNGFYTYDRKVCKVEPEVMRDAAEKLAAAVQTPGRD